MPTAYDQVIQSSTAQKRLYQHYHDGAGLYKLWGSPGSVFSAILWGWDRADHPAQLHYAWDLKQAPSINEAINNLVRQGMRYLGVNELEYPRILEPGCGIGGVSSLMAKEHPNYIIDGISLVTSQIAIARKRANYLGLPNINYLVGNFLQVAVQDETYDAILAVETFCYIPVLEKLSLLAEMFRVLKPGHKLVVFDGYLRRRPDSFVEATLYEQFKKGWTLPDLVSAQRFSHQAQEVGFRVGLVKDCTVHVKDCVLLVYKIARTFKPFIKLAHFLEKNKINIPLLKRLFKNLGFNGQIAKDFADTCLIQKPLTEWGVCGYYVHVLEKPPRRTQ